MIRDNDGEIILDTDVEQILVDDDGVRGVRLPATGDGAQKRELRARTVISAADLKHTYGQLLAEANVPSLTRHRVQKYRMAAPLFVVYLMLDRDLPAEGVGNQMVRQSRR